MGVHLIGGGWDGDVAPLVYGPFLSEVGGEGVVGCLLVDEGDGAEQFARYDAVLRVVSPDCRPVPLLVGGGLTPAYQDALDPVIDEVVRVVRDRSLPYAGFSAGAVVAARRALVGGWLDGGVPVCPGDAAEDLEEIEVRDGLGLVPYAVDVHAAQWGTLARLVAAVARGDAESGVALDENTLLTAAGDGRAVVAGAGRVHLVHRTRDANSVVVRAFRAGDTLTR